MIDIAQKRIHKVCIPYVPVAKFLYFANLCWVSIFWFSAFNYFPNYHNLMIKFQLCSPLSTQPPHDQLPVEEQPWFFGDIDRNLAERMCPINGDFLVRYRPRQNTYILTCNWNGARKHFAIQQIIDVSGVTCTCMIVHVHL